MPRRWSIILAPMLLSASLVYAGTPLGGGDGGGFVPPDAETAKCEAGVGSALINLAGRLVKCNIKDSDAKVKAATKLGCLVNDPSFDGPGCQVGARARFDAMVAKLKGCPACLDGPSIRDAWTRFVNLNDDMPYGSLASECSEDVGQPVQDRTGDIPIYEPGVTGGSSRHCTDEYSKVLNQFATGLLKCHFTSAQSQRVGKAFDEDACRLSAAAKYDAGTTKTGDCTAALQPGVGGYYGTFRDETRTMVDAMSGGPFCASPSGAFVE